MCSHEIFSIVFNKYFPNFSTIIAVFYLSFHDIKLVNNMLEITNKIFKRKKKYFSCSEYR